MPITFDEVTADVTPPDPAPGSERRDEAPATSPGVQDLPAELRRLEERAQRLRAD